MIGNVLRIQRSYTQSDFSGQIQSVGRTISQEMKEEEEEETKALIEGDEQKWVIL